MKLALKKLLQAHPSIQVSTLLSGSLSTPSSRTAFVPPTSFNSIASASPTGTNTVTFSSIPATYKSLHIRIHARDVYTGATLGGAAVYIQCNGDTAGNYANHQMFANGTSFSHGNQSSTTYMKLDNASVLGSSASVYGVGIFEIADYASTTKTKTGIGHFGASNGAVSANFEVGVCSSFWNSTSAITSLTISQDYNFASGSLIALYGVS